MLVRATIAALMCMGILTAQSAVHEAYAELPGARIFYIDTGGNGVPVVFLHAATGSSRVWEYQIPAFTAAGYRVVAFDRRGWGRTVTDSAGSQTGADDLAGLAYDHLGITRVHLVGTAAGAFVALDFALSFPQRVRSLVIANTIGGVQDRDFLELGRRLRPPQFDALPPEFRELGPAYRAANPEGTRRWMELEKISRPDGPLSAGAAHAKSPDILVAGIDPVAVARVDRRRRSIRTAACDEALCGANREFRVPGGSGCRALNVLGAARGFQSRGSELHR